MAAKTEAKKAAAGDMSLVRLRVDLVRNGWQDFQEGDVSRTVLVRQKHTLEQLHQCIFKAFDRFDEHMYEFIVGENPNGPEADHYGMADAFEGIPDMGMPKTKNAAKATIGSLGLKPGEVFFYIFDFGDEWEHQITVEAVDLPAEKGRRYPRVEKIVGKSPAQYPDEDEEYEDE